MSDGSPAGDGFSLVYGAAAAALSASGRVALLSALNGPAHHLGVLRKLGVADASHLTLLLPAEWSCGGDSAALLALPGGDGSGGGGGSGAAMPVAALLAQCAALAAAPGDAPLLLVIDDMWSLVTRCARPGVAAVALARGLAALAAPPRVRVLLRCAAAGNVALRAAPSYAAVSAAAAVLAQCDAVATLAPLATVGRTLDVLGRLSLERRPAVRMQASASASAAERTGSGGDADGGSGGGGGWVSAAPRTCLYRIAEASCEFQGVGAVEFSP